MDIVSPLLDPAALRQRLGDLTDRELAIAQEAVRYALSPQPSTPPQTLVPLTALDAAPASFQARVDPWLIACFGEQIADDKTERNHRFLEESLELVQACGCTRSEAIQLVDYVYGRDIGEIPQEVGGVMVTLAALCRAQRVDMAVCGEIELARIWTKIEKIRAKQAAKPKYSVIPIEQAPTFRVSVQTMVESHQTSYLVCLDRGDRPLDAKPWDPGRITPYQTLVKSQADFEAGEWSEFLLGTQPVEMTLD